MNFREQGHAPVAYIEMDPKASPKSIASSILNFYGIPHNFKSATQHQLTDLALDALHWARRAGHLRIADPIGNGSPPGSERSRR